MMRAPFAVGTKIIAVRDFDPIREGQPGIITGTADVPFFFWKRVMYLCTFQGNMKVAARPQEIGDFKHNYSLAELEIPVQ